MRSRSAVIGYVIVADGKRMYSLRLPPRREEDPLDAPAEENSSAGEEARVEKLSGCVQICDA